MGNREQQLQPRVRTKGRFPKACRELEHGKVGTQGPSSTTEHYFPLGEKTYGNRGRNVCEITRNLGDALTTSHYGNSVKARSIGEGGHPSDRAIPLQKTNKPSEHGGNLRVLEI
jgi:hypothetical protein